MKLLVVVICSLVFLTKESQCYHELTIQNALNVLKNVRVGEEDDLCEKQIGYLKENLRNSTDDMWGLRMVDAWSKLPPAGLLQGNIGELGNFDECIKIDVTVSDTRLRGKYCLGRIGEGSSTVEVSEPLANFKKSAKVKAYKHSKLGAIKNSAVFIGLPVALCLPNSCSKQAIENISNQLLENYLNSAISISYDCQDFDDAYPEFTAGAIASICFFAIIAAIIITSSIYDYYGQTYKIPPKSQLYVAFSAYTNFPKLMKVTSGSADLQCLNGIRVLSMVWVIIGHTFMMHTFEPLANLMDVNDWANQWHSMFIASGPLAVDTFLAVGGLLVVYIYMKSVHNKVRFNIFMYYIHRYLRLTPALGASVILNSSLVGYFGTGPVWKTGISAFRLDICKDYWWGTLLYLQNYIYVDRICVGETWYLNVDMQLYFIAPIFLLILSRWRKVGLSLLGICAIVFTAVPFFLTWHYELMAIVTDLYRDGQEFNTKYYLRTHGRAAPWFIGAIAGYFIADIRFNGKKIKINKYLNAFIWLLVLTLMVVIVLVGHDTLREEEYNKLGSALYNTFIRPTWGLCIAWIAFACVTNNGGIINFILSQPIFQVMNRFTYSMYLTHLTIIYVLALSQKTGIYFSIFETCTSFWSIFMVTFILSIYWVLAFESPIIILEKVIFGRR